MSIYIRTYIFLIVVVLFSFCSSDDDDRSKRQGASASDRSVYAKESTKSLGITKTEYYKDYEQSYYGQTKYIKPITKEKSKGIRHIRLYYSGTFIIREEEYNERGILSRYTKPAYNNAGEKTSEKWYTRDNTIILERGYKAGRIEEEIIFASGRKNEKIKYIYDEANVLIRENHYDVYSNLVFYKEFEYQNNILTKSHFYSPDGIIVSTHKEYYPKEEKGLYKKDAYSLEKENKGPRKKGKEREKEKRKRPSKPSKKEVKEKETKKSLKQDSS